MRRFKKQREEAGGKQAVLVGGWNCDRKRKGRGAFQLKGTA